MVVPELSGFLSWKLVTELILLPITFGCFMNGVSAAAAPTDATANSIASIRLVDRSDVMVLLLRRCN
jgi:hypothetical protein